MKVYAGPLETTNILIASIRWILEWPVSSLMFAATETHVDINTLFKLSDFLSTDSKRSRRIATLYLTVAC